MKLIFILLHSLSSLLASPVVIDGEYRFIIKNIKPTHMLDYAYEMKTTNSKERLILDCQSFIHGLHIFWKESPDEEEMQVDGILLSESECEYIAYHAFTTTVKEQELCLKIKQDSWQIRVGDDPALCYLP